MENTYRPTFMGMVTPVGRFSEAANILNLRSRSSCCPEPSEPSRHREARETREARAVANSTVSCLSDLSYKCRTLSDISADIERENTRLCGHLAAVTTKRRQRQFLRKTAQMSEEPLNSLFHSFFCLPTELQLMIWEAAANPPTCQHVVAIWQTARTPSQGERDNGHVKMPGAHACDPAGLWFFEDDLGLWMTCRASRTVIQRLYADAYERLASKNRFGWLFMDNCPDFADPEWLEEQGRRVRRLNREGIQYRQFVRDLDSHIKSRLLPLEHHVRKNRLRIETTAQKADAESAEHTEHTEGNNADTEPPQERENALAKIVRKIYEIDGDLPLGADDGPIPHTALKRFCPELRMGYLLGVPWG